MSNTDARYNVRDCTQNPDHASIDEVCEELVLRAKTPRTNHQDAHFDVAMADVVDRYGEEAVREVVQHILTGDVTFRTAAADLDMRSIDGVRIGTTARWILGELNGTTTDHPE
jgi:hypothetical protein